MPICSATFNCLKTYGSKIGGLSQAQLKPGIVIPNLYLGIEGTKTNIQNIKEYLLKLQDKEARAVSEYDQLEKELMKQAPVGKF